MHLSPYIAAFAAVLLLAAAPLPAAPVNGPEPVFEPCALEGHPALPSVQALCARVMVPLDPGRQSGQQIELRVARVPAMSATPLPDPLVVIAGGPGQSSTEFYAAMQGAFARVRQQRDILLVDQRGTGGSRRLDCPRMPEPDRLAALERLGEELTQAVQECLRQLPSDPRFFTTSAAVRDLEEVRRQLGYPALNVYGISYGTRVAQHYLRRHPGTTRALILDAPVPADIALGPAIAPLAQRALDQAMLRCSRVEACFRAFPALDSQLDSLLARLDAEPVALEMPDPVSGEPVMGTLTGVEFRSMLRMLSYSPHGVALIPFLIDQSHAGYYLPAAAQARMIGEDLEDALALAMHHAVVCTEDAPFFEIGPQEQAAMDRSYLGSVIVDAIVEVCTHWPRGLLDEDLREPLESDRPVLILSGEHDPITPPAYGERVLAGLSRGRHLIGPGQGHGLVAQGCLPQVVAAFLDRPDPGALEADCVASLGPIPFFLDFAGPGP